MDIFEDYNTWKGENIDLITKLVKNHSKTIIRFNPVFAVVDYLYYENKKRKLSEDEKLIFSTGFDYVYDNISTISSILNSTFNNNYEEMEKCSQTINLLLYIMDFEAELNNQGNLKKHINKLNDLESKVNNYLDKKENAPDEYFQILDDIINDINDVLDEEIHTVDQIFYEIALEYNIYKDDNDFDLFNDIINKQIEKMKNVS